MKVQKKNWGGGGRGGVWGGGGGGGRGSGPEGVRVDVKVELKIL